jgi:biopolymer transport protein ExbB/TolQ
MMFWISLVSVVMSPFSFLILLIWILLLCPLVSLSKNLSILLIFSKQQNKTKQTNKKQKKKPKNTTAPGLVDSLYSTFCFYFVDSCPEFDYFLLSTPLG